MNVPCIRPQQHRTDAEGVGYDAATAEGYEEPTEDPYEKKQIKERHTFYQRTIASHSRLQYAFLCGAPMLSLIGGLVRTKRAPFSVLVLLHRLVCVVGSGYQKKMIPAFGVQSCNRAAKQARAAEGCFVYDGGCRAVGGAQSRCPAHLSTCSFFVPSSCVSFISPPFLPTHHSMFSFTLL